MTNSKTQRPPRHGSFHNNPPKPAGIKKEWSPAARKAAETSRAGTKHHAAVCHTRAGGGSLDESGRSK